MFSILKNRVFEIEAIMVSAFCLSMKYLDLSAFLLFSI